MRDPDERLRYRVAPTDDGAGGDVQTSHLSKCRASGAPGATCPVRVLGEDVAGVWMLIEPLTPYLHDDGWVVAVATNAILALVPRHGRWVACTSHVGAKVDLCRRISIRPERIEFEDVELDVVWRWGEPAKIVDLDEFEDLALPAGDVHRHRADAAHIRSAADRGLAPFGPAFRQRLVDCAPPADPRLEMTWAGGAGPHLVEPVSEFLGRGLADRWLASQRAGAGWMLCGGGDAITAIAWIAADGDARRIARASTRTGQPMSDLLLRAARGLGDLPAPPC